MNVKTRINGKDRRQGSANSPAPSLGYRYPICLVGVGDDADGHVADIDDTR